MNMSGNMGEIPLAIGGMGIDPWRGLAEYNQSIASNYAPAQAAAQAGLTQGQAGLANVQAQTGQLGLDWQRAMLAPLMGGHGGIGQHADSNAPLPWTVGGSAPGSISSYGAPSGQSGQAGQSGQSGGQTAPSGQPSSESIASTAAQEQPFVSANGIMYPGLGVPLPRAMLMGVFRSPDPAKALNEALAMRKQQMAMLIGNSFGPDGKVDPALWHDSVQSMYDQGLIDSRHSWQLYDKPAAADVLRNSLLPPELQTQQKAAAATAEGWAKVAPAIAEAGGEAQARATQHMIEVEVTNPDGSKRIVKMPEAASSDAYYRGQGGGAGSLGDLANSSPIAGGDFSKRVIGGEGGWAPGVRPNASGPGGTPTSSAAGGPQFIKDTWLGVMNRHFPDLVNGKTPEQVLAMRSDDNLAQRATQYYAQDNAPKLQAAGFEANSATLALAHGFGPDGAIAILKAPAGTPLTTIFPGTKDAPNPVIAANPTYASLTNRDVWHKMTDRFGLRPVDFQAQAATGPAGGGGGGTALGPFVGPQIPSAAQEAQMKVSQDQIGKDQESVAQFQEAQQKSSAAQSQVITLRNIAEKVPTGAGGDWRARIANYMQTFGGDWANKFLAMTTNLNPKDAQYWQELTKMSVMLAGQAEQQTVGARGGYNLTKLFGDALPNVNTQPEAIRAMSNVLLIQHQFVMDHAEGAAAAFDKNRSAFLADPMHTPYSPITNYNKQFNDTAGTSSSRVYAAASAYMNGADFAKTAKGLSVPQITAMISVIRRADPSWVPTKQQANEPAPQQAKPAPVRQGY